MFVVVTVRNWQDARYTDTVDADVREGKDSRMNPEHLEKFKWSFAKTEKQINKSILVTLGLRHLWFMLSGQVGT